LSFEKEYLIESYGKHGLKNKKAGLTVYWKSWNFYTLPLTLDFLI
jgi:hypothetical protein